MKIILKKRTKTINGNQSILNKYRNLKQNKSMDFPAAWLKGNGAWDQRENGNTHLERVRQVNQLKSANLVTLPLISPHTPILLYIANTGFTASSQILNSLVKTSFNLYVVRRQRWWSELDPAVFVLLPSPKPRRRFVYLKEPWSDVLCHILRSQSTVGAHQSKQSTQLWMKDNINIKSKF